MDGCGFDVKAFSEFTGYKHPAMREQIMQAEDAPVQVDPIQRTRPHNRKKSRRDPRRLKKAA